MGADAEIEYFMQSESPSLETMEQKYMKVLEHSYKEEKNVMLIKKIKIKASIRIIQRAWRHYYKLSKMRKYILIQNWYRNKKKSREAAQQLQKTLKDIYFAKKLQRILKFRVKIKKSWKLSDSQKLEVIEKYTNHMTQAVKIQSTIRQLLARVKARKLKLLKTFQRPVSRIKIHQHRKVFSLTKPIDSELMRRIGYCKLEVDAMQKYIYMEHEHFDKNWREYEQKLEHYITNDKKFEDWHSVNDESGTSFWINNKTLKKSKNPPSVKSIKVNKQKLRIEAEEEQQIQIAMVDLRRKRFSQVMAALALHRGNDMKQIRIKFIADL